MFCGELLCHLTPVRPGMLISMIKTSMEALDQRAGPVLCLTHHLDVPISSSRPMPA
jgi:hypothetical protein